ncbi:MAG: M23 family metallopeptidase [Firmicutes bacterium]|nr:M23 family metallopeptidase [Bacillota bacterium]
MQRQKRCFTIMIVPHSEEATYSFRLPLFVGQLIVGLFVVGLSAFLFLAYGYRNARLDAEEVRILRQANQVQQDEINAFAGITHQLLERIEQIEDLAGEVADKLGLGQDLEENDKESSEHGSHEENRLYASRSDQDRVLDRATENICLLQTLIPENAHALENLKEEVDEYVRRLAATPSIWPARGRFTSGFGMRRTPYGGGSQFHYGVDIAGSYGSPVYATADGQVSNASYRGAFGNLVIVHHGYGFKTYYAHLSKFAVSPGTWVKRGQVLGYMGRSGRATGTHLHYEVHVNGVAVNPSRYMH